MFSKGLPDTRQLFSKEKSNEEDCFITVCIALCAAVWPRSAELRGYPAKPVMLAVSADIEAKPEGAEEATKEKPDLLYPTPILYTFCHAWYNFLKTRRKRGGSMKEKKKTLLDLDRVPTLDELRAFFRENDFSAAAYMDIDYEKLDADTVEALEYIKGMMDEHWEPLSREMGRKASSCYYGKDNPLIAMRDNMENLVASGVLKLLEEHPERAAEILMEFTHDPNIEQNADAFLHNAVETLMQVMNYEEAADNHSEHSRLRGLQSRKEKQLSFQGF